MGLLWIILVCTALVVAAVLGFRYPYIPAKSRVRKSKYGFETRYCLERQRFRLSYTLVALIMFVAWLESGAFLFFRYGSNSDDPLAGFAIMVVLAIVNGIIAAIGFYISFRASVCKIEYYRMKYKRSVIEDRTLISLILTDGHGSIKKWYQQLCEDDDQDD